MNIENTIYKVAIVAAILAAVIFLAHDAHAQQTIYDYSGAPMSGIETGDPWPYSPPAACTGCMSIDGSMTLSQPLGDNFSGMVTPTSMGFNYISATNTYVSENNTDVGAMSYGTVNVTTNAQGQIINWDVEVTSNAGNGPTASANSSVTSSGDSGVYQAPGGNVTNSDVYTVSSNSGGSWLQGAAVNSAAFVTAAPEISADSATAGLTLLVGCLLALRGRRGAIR